MERGRWMARDGEGTKERRVGNFGVESHVFFEWNRNDGKPWKNMEKHVCAYLGRRENHMQHFVGRVFFGGPLGSTNRKIWRTVLRGNLSRPVFMVDFPYIMSLVLEVLWLGMFYVVFPGPQVCLKMEYPEFLW